MNNELRLVTIVDSDFEFPEIQTENLPKDFMNHLSSKHFIRGNPIKYMDDGKVTCDILEGIKKAFEEFNKSGIRVFLLSYKLKENARICIIDSLEKAKEILKKYGTVMHDLYPQSFREKDLLGTPFALCLDYKKISKNIKQLNIKEISAEEMCIMAEYFADTAKKYNLKIESCAEQIDLERFGINHGKCIDNELIEKITGYKLSVGRDNQRNACGCIKCIDIGEYNTCMHKCLYCYANINKDAAFKNYKLHDTKSLLLIGYVDEIKDKITDRNIKDTKSLKKEDKFSAVQNNIDSLLS